MTSRPPVQIPVRLTEEQRSLLFRACRRVAAETESRSLAHALYCAALSYANNAPHGLLVPLEPGAKRRPLQLGVYPDQLSVLLQALETARDLGAASRGHALAEVCALTCAEPEEDALRADGPDPAKSRAKGKGRWIP